MGHAEVTALTQVDEAILQMAAEFPLGNSEAAQRVSGKVELFVPHYPCSSCTGAIVQFAERYPHVKIYAGHDDWRHWVRRLSGLWDPSDTRHHQLSINARQLRELDQSAVDEIPLAYQNALRSTLGGTTGISGDILPKTPGANGYSSESAAPDSSTLGNGVASAQAPVKTQSFY